MFHVQAPSRGKTAPAIVELVDMYKTIAELLDLGAVEAGVMGSSFAPLVTVDPSASHAVYAFSQGES